MEYKSDSRWDCLILLLISVVRKEITASTQVLPSESWNQETAEEQSKVTYNLTQNVEFEGCIALFM